MRTRRSTLAVTVTATALLLSACGGDDPPEAGSAGGDEPRKRLKLAFLPGVTANPYFQAEIESVKEVAAEEGADVTVIDSQLDAQKQVVQLQDLGTSQKYDGIVVVPLNGAALVPAVRQALDSGTDVAAADVPIGVDPTSADTQVKGVSVYSGRPFSVIGQNLGKLAIKACEGQDPCKTAFVYGVKASTYDQALFGGFKSAIENSPNVQVVAEAEGQYTREGGLKAVQDLLQGNQDLNVLVAVDQSALGAESAFEETNSAKKVKIIGFGGTSQAIEAVKAGRWYGDVVQVPRTEARLAAEGLIATIRGQRTDSYADPVAAVKAPDDGRVVRENADEFEPEYDG